jgi:TLC domain
MDSTHTFCHTSVWASVHDILRHDTTHDTNPGTGSDVKAERKNEKMTGWCAMDGLHSTFSPRATDDRLGCHLHQFLSAIITIHHPSSSVIFFFFPHCVNNPTHHHRHHHTSKKPHLRSTNHQAANRKQPPVSMTDKLAAGAMRSSSSSFTSLLFWQADVHDRIVALNGRPDMFLDWNLLQGHVFPVIVATSLSLCLIYVFLYQFVAERLIPTKDLLRDKNKQVFKKMKISYQLTNLITNLSLGLAGVYASTMQLPTQPPPVEDQVSGFHQVVYFSSMQLGYQLWAIPLGLVIGETLPMMVHHFTVIIVAGMSGFLTNGFRYWTPFFYGVIELSSVPLAVMNAFKDNPELIVRYPRLYTNVRLTFAALFLYIRILMFVPRNLNFLRDHFTLFSHYPHNLPYVIFMGSASLSSFILILLQLYWADLIIKGLVKSFVKGQQRPPNDESTMSKSKQA